MNLNSLANALTKAASLARDAQSIRTGGASHVANRLTRKVLHRAADKIANRLAR